MLLEIYSKKRNRLAGEKTKLNYFKWDLSIAQVSEYAESLELRGGKVSFRSDHVTNPQAFSQCS